MKQLFTLFIVLTTIAAKAQLAVADVGTNIKLQQSTILQNAIRGYTSLQTKLQNSTLSEATKTAKDVKNQFNLLQKTLDVADKFQQSQMVKDFFNNQRTVISLINNVNNSLYDPKFIISSTGRAAVRKYLNEAYLNATKSVSAISGGFLKEALNLSDRLSFCEEANKYLSNALQNIQQAEQIVREAKSQASNAESKKAFIGAIF